MLDCCTRLTYVAQRCIDELLTFNLFFNFSVLDFLLHFQHRVNFGAGPSGNKEKEILFTGLSRPDDENAWNNDVYEKYC